MSMQRPSDRVLQWLYSSLSTQYESVDRTYTDVVKCLTDHNTLSPRTDIHTYDNGQSALLLVLQGTMAVPFRGATYHFPLAIWLPNTYPREPPMIYVMPTDTMAIRPGQHVSVEGRIYHPYLAHWRDHWNMSNLVDILSILRDVFAKEPPVVSRQQQAAAQSRTFIQKPVASPPPVPQLPRELRSPGQHAQSQQKPSQKPVSPPPPPPPPPKLHEALSSASPRPEHATGYGQTAPQQPPTLPPKPYQQNGSAVSPVSSRAFQSPPIQAEASASLPSQIRNNISPPSRGPQLQSPSNLPGLNSPRQPLPPPLPPLPHTQQPPPQQSYSYAQNVPQMALQQSNPQHPGHFPPHAQPQLGLMQQPPHGQQPAPRPAQDLLSGPLEAMQAASTQDDASKIAPPIPPNPEKDELLQRLTTELTNKLNQSLTQNAAAVTSLEAQNTAMRQAYAAIQSELAELQGLDNMLASNEKILHEAMREADRVMESMAGKEVPNVDDVLVAPTIVGEQLYGLVADERAIDDAMFALTRALDAGRVEGDVFVKHTRTLAREQFLKKALIKKIGRGMGLAMDT